MEWNYGNGIAEIGGKKILQLVCGNAIAEIGVKKKYWEKWNGIRKYHCHNSIPLFFSFFFLRNDKCTQFLQQILSGRLLLLD